MNNVAEAQNQFVKNIAHELRNPLAVIKTNSDAALIDTDQLTKEEAVQTITDNLKQVDTITDILKGLQLMSEFRGKEDKLTKKDADFRSSAEKIIKAIAKIYDGEVDINKSNGTTLSIKFKS
jgi:signal transduction histidine kinase